MATKRTGWTDSQQSSRLTLGSVFLALYAGSMPVSDGTGGNEVSPASRPAITFGAVAQDGNGRHYQDNNAVSGITLTNTTAAHLVGFGICTAATGATVIYLDRLKSSFQVSAGQTITIPAGAIRVYAEPPTI